MSARRFFSYLLCLAFLFTQDGIAQMPQQIVTDGKTQTTVTTNGNITGVTTGTVLGSNGYNSFRTFNVDQGYTVNLVLPAGADNLLNLVNGERSTIDGVLNSIKDGQIGGNVYFINPYGVVIGSNGVVNVGSLVAVAPTKAFMEAFFNGVGDPSAASTAAVLNGMVPLSSDGLIVVRGKINALRDIKLAAADISNAGMINTGALFLVAKPDFSQILNVKGLQTGAQVAIVNGNIEILAGHDFENTGVIAAEGSDGVNGGSIHIAAGNDIRLIGDSLIASSGRGQSSNAGDVIILADGNALLASKAALDAQGGEGSGNGGLIELSAKKTLTISGGEFAVGANAGSAGSIVIDPADLIVDGDLNTNGAPLPLTADKSIKIGCPTANCNNGSNVVTISTQALDGDGFSTADSGNITVTAPQITVFNDARLLAGAVNDGVTTYAGGDVTLTATQIVEDVFGPGIGVLFNLQQANAGIDVRAAEITGKNITLSATATSSKIATLAPQDNVDPNDPTKNLPTTIPEGLEFAADLASTRLPPIVGKAAASIANATAAVNVGAAEITGSGNVNLEANATAEAKITAAGVYLAFGSSTADAKVQVGNGAHITAGGVLNVNAETKNTLDVTAEPITYLPLKFAEQTRTQTGPTITVAYGRGSSNSTAAVESGASLTAGTINVTAENNNEFSTATKSRAYAGTSAGFGAGVSIGDYDSYSKAYVDGSATTVQAPLSAEDKTGTLTISAISNNTTQTIAEASVSENKKPESDDPNAKQNDINIREKIDGKQTDTRAGDSTQQFSAAAAVTLIDSVNDARALIGAGATVSSAGDLQLTSNAEESLNVRARGESSEAQLSVGGAFLAADYTNTAESTIGSGAIVNAARNLETTASAHVANPRVDYFMDLALGREKWDTSRLLDVGQQAYTDFIDRITETGEEDLKGQLFDAVEQATWGPLLNTSVGSRGAAESQGGFGIGGNAEFLDIHNTATAAINDGAKVNLAPSYSNTAQTVAVTASGNVRTGNSIGNETEVEHQGDGSGGESGGGTSVGLGGSYSDVYYQNTVKAYIGDGAQVQASVVDVEANSSNLFLNWARAGSEGNTFGIEGVFTKFKLDNITEARIEEGAQVLTSNTPADTISVNVSALSENYGLLAAGTKDKTGTFGLGAAVAVNEINDTTSAYIGDSTGTVTPGGFVEGDDVTVNARSTSRLISLAYAYGASKSDAQAEKKDAKQAGNGKGYGFGVSGNVTFNSLTQKVDAHITDALVTAHDALNVKANADSLLAGVSGTLMMSSSGGLTGAYSENTQNRTTQAYIERSTIDALSANINAGSNDLFFAVSAGGALQGKYFNIAGSVNNNWSITTTEAWIGSGTTLDADGAVAVDAGNSDFIVSMAGAVATSGKLGVGAGVDIEELDNKVHAAITGAEVTAGGNVQVTSSDQQDIYSFGAAVALLSNVTLDGAVVVWDIDTDTESTIGTGAQVSTPDNLLVSGSGDLWLFEVAGQVAGGKDVGFGASGVVNTINAMAKATVAGGASVSAGGNGTPTKDANRGVLLTASNKETLKSFAAGAAGAGKAGIAGSGVVNVWTKQGEEGANEEPGVDIVTEASIGEGAKVNEDTTGANAGQSVALKAVNDTDILAIAGGAAGGGTAGIGAGADVAVINKTTKATIADHALVNALNDITVQALATEKALSIAAVLEGGGSAGIAGAASVYTLNDTTAAYVGAATLDAADSVLIAAEDDTHLVLLDGNLGGSGGYSVGASGSVTVITKNTTATTGAATITARGNGGEQAGETAAGVSANTGLFDVTYAPYGSSGVGEFPAPDAKTAGVFNDPVLTGHRVATPQRQTVRGLAVSATSVNDLLTLAAGGQGAGTLAVPISGAVNIMNDTTTAAIGDGAHVNPQTSGASDEQSVLVAAGSDYGHFGVAGGIGGAGAGAVVPGADITLVTNNTTAKIGSGAEVNALEDVTVRANAQEDLFSISGTLAGSGGFSLAGSFSFFNVNNATKSFVDSGAVVKAGGDLQVLANDSTDTDILAGSGALGLGIGGVGGSVSLVILNKDTQAYLAADTSTDAKAQTKVEAVSSENVEAITAAGGGGQFVGIAGAVSIELLNSNTRAAIHGGAAVNQGGTSEGQDVLASATNTASVDTKGGTLAGSIGASIAGSVDVGSIKNDTSATIGDAALVSAGGNIGVDAAETRTVRSKVGGASGGAVGIAASVSVWGIGSELDTESLKSSTYQGEGKQDSAYTDVQGYADSQLSNGTIASLTGMLTNADPNSDGGQYINDAGAAVAAHTTGTPVTTVLAGTSVTGTSAKVDGGTLRAGGNIGVNATDSVDLGLIAGTVAAGAAGVGGSVDVATISVNSEASLTGDVSAGGNVTLHSSRSGTLDGDAYAGQAGLVGLGAAYVQLNDNGTTAAFLGGSVENADAVNVTADTDRTIRSTAGEAAIGVGAVGASLAKSSAGGSTSAYVSESALIGQGGEVGTLQVSGTDTTDAKADATALGAGILTGMGSGAEATANGTVAAYVGKDAQIAVTDDLSITATSTDTASADARGVIPLAEVSVGYSQADALAAPTVSGYIGESADVHADNINVSSRYYNPTDAGVTASASTSSGTLVGTANGSVATASSSPTVETFISKDATVGADTDVVLSSVSNSNVDASANGLTAGLLTLNGYTKGTALVDNSNTVAVQDGASVAAGEDIRVTAETDESANTPTVSGSGYGGVIDNKTVGSAWITGTTAADVAGTLSAGDELVVRAVVSEEAKTQPTGAARSVLGSGAIVRAFAGGAALPSGLPSSTPVDTPFVNVAADTSMTAHSVTLDAHITKLLFEANADSRSFAVGKADPTAEARVIVIANPQVTLGAGSEIVAPDSITLSAVIDSDPELIHTTSHSFAKIEATSVVGTITSIAQNDTSLAPNVSVEEGATLRTNNLTVETHGPIQPEDESKSFYTRNAETSGTSIVNWVLKPVQTVVTKIFGWIPFVRTIIKTIFKWIAEVLDSDTQRIESGDYVVAPAIHLNGTLYQGTQSNVNPYLLVDAAGNVVTATGMTALLDAIGRLVVSDVITNTAKSSVTLNAPGGTVDGNFDIYHNTSFDSVTVSNNSPYDLVFNSITPLSTNDEEPAMNVEADDISGLQYRFIAQDEHPPTAITIHNNSGSDIFFLGAITNGSGSIDITNANGDILGGPENLLQAHQLTITAPHGTVGETATPLNISLVNGGAAMQYETTNNPTLSVVTGHDLFANVTADKFLSESPADPSSYQIAADVNSVFAGGQVRLNLAGRALVPQADSPTLVVQPVTVAGVFNLNNSFSAGGDINLAAAPGTQINVNGTLASGFPDIGMQIASDGSVSSATMNWPDSVDLATVNIGSMQQGGGHIAITGGAVLGGNGTIRVLDGYSHIAIANDSALDLAIGDLNLGSRINGSITLNGAAVPLNSNVGDLATATSGYSTGEITIQNNGESDVELLGNIANPTGLTRIINALGNITSGGPEQLLASAAAEFTANNGAIGTSTAPINLAPPSGQSNGSAGTASALAQLGIYLRETAGDLYVSRIESQSADIFLISDGSILNGNSDTGSINLLGNNINLTALGNSGSPGSIGETGRRLVVNNRNAITTGSAFNTGSVNSLDMVAAGDIYVEERTGDLLSEGIQSLNGNVDVLVSGGGAKIGEIKVSPQSPDSTTPAGSFNKSVVILVQGSLLEVGKITSPNVLTLTVQPPDGSAGTATPSPTYLRIGEADVFSKVTARAGDIELAKIVALNPSTATGTIARQENGLHLDITGWIKPDGRSSPTDLADSVNINVEPCSYCSTIPAVVFDRYHSNVGNVTAKQEWLEMIDTIVGTSAYLETPWEAMNIFSKVSQRQGATQYSNFYLFMIGNKLATTGDRAYWNTRSKTRTQYKLTGDLDTIVADLIRYYGLNGREE